MCSTKFETTLMIIMAFLYNYLYVEGKRSAIDYRYKHN